MGLISKLLFFFVTFLLLAESFFYPGIIAHYFLVLPIVVVVGAWIIIGILKFKSLLIEKPNHYLVLTIGTLVLYFFSLFLQQLNVFLYPTFTLQYLHLHALPLEMVAWFWLGVLVIYFRVDWFKKLHPLSSFLLPFLLLVFLMIIQHNYAHEIFNKLKKEDGLFEYLTFAAYLIGSGFSLAILKNIWSKWRSSWMSWPLLFGFLVVAVVFFFIAGEEISWGQRIFNIATPQDYAAVNTQQEITIHNHNDVINYVYYAYLYLSLLISLAWLPVKLTIAGGKRFGVNWLYRLGEWMRWVAPRWWMVSWFLPMIVYVPLRETFGYIRYGQWEEMSEMFLSVGLVVYLWWTYRRSKLVKQLI